MQISEKIVEPLFPLENTFATHIIITIVKLIALSGTLINLAGLRLYPDIALNQH